MRTNHFLTTLCGLLSISMALGPWAYAVGDDACNNTCDQFKKFMTTSSGTHVHEDKSENQMSMAAVLYQCGTPPAPGPSGTPLPAVGSQDPATVPAPTGANTGNSDYDNCFSKLTAEWGDLGPYCATVDDVNTAETANLVAAIAYTAAAATCFAACALKNGPWYGAAYAACLIAAGVGAGADIDGLINEFQTDGNWANKAENGVSTVSAAVGAGVAIAGAITAVTTNAIGAGAKESCYAGAIFTVIAGAKWLTYGLNESSGNDACTQVNKLAGFTPGNALGLTTPPPPSAPRTPDGAMSMPGGGSAGGGSTGGSHSTIPLDAIQKLTSDPNKFPSGMSLDATAGGFDGIGSKLFDMLPNRNQIPDALKAAGTDMNEFGQAVASQGPAGALGAMAGLPDEVKQAASDLQAKVKEQLSKINPNVLSASMSGGGGSKSKSGSGSGGPLGMLGMRAPVSSAPKDLSFDKVKKKDLDPTESTDIWHTGYLGSIFSIVSHKLVKTGDRIEALEWVSPLNRALAGLPNKKPLVPSVTKVAPAPANHQVFGGGRK